MNLSLPLAIEAFDLPHPTGTHLDWHQGVEVILHEKQAGREEKYLTLRPTSVEDKALPKTLVKALRYFVPKANSVLVVGMGNPSVAADALGVQTVKRINPRPLVKAFAPDVQSHTGLPTAEIVKALQDRFVFDLVVLVDALACSSPQNLVRTIQLTDRGLAPGQGVGNVRQAVDDRSVGAKVLTVGIPLIAHTDPFGEDLCVTPTDIERVVGRCADLLGQALNTAWR